MKNIQLVKYWGYHPTHCPQKIMISPFLCSISLPVPNLLKICSRTVWNSCCRLSGDCSRERKSSKLEPSNCTRQSAFYSHNGCLGSQPVKLASFGREERMSTFSWHMNAGLASISFVATTSYLALVSKCISIFCQVKGIRTQEAQFINMLGF